MTVFDSAIKVKEGEGNEIGEMREKIERSTEERFLVFAEEVYFISSVPWLYFFFAYATMPRKVDRERP